MSWRPSLFINANSPVAKTNLPAETWKALYDELEYTELKGIPLVDRLLEITTQIKTSGSKKAKEGGVDMILGTLQQWKDDPARNAQPRVPEQLKSAIQQTLRDFFPAPAGGRRRASKKTRKLRRRQRNHAVSVHKKTKHRPAHR